MSNRTPSTPREKDVCSRICLSMASLFMLLKALLKSRSRPTPLVSVLFTAASLLFIHFQKCFSFLFQYFFVIKFYLLNIFLAQYKHTFFRQLQASHGNHMKAAHNVLYMKKHTQTYASYPPMDISCMISRSVV